MKLANEDYLKITHIIVGLGRGGAETVLRNFILSDTCNQHSVVSLSQGGGVADDLRGHGIAVHELSLHNGTIFSRLNKIGRMIGLLRSSNADVVHTWMYHSDLLGGVLTRMFTRSKVVWCVRSGDIEGGKNRLTLLIRWVCSLLSKYVPHAIIFVSSRARKQHIAMGYDSRKSWLVTNGFNVYDSIHQACDLYSKKNLEETMFISVARHNIIKDHETLLRAFAKVCRNNNRAQLTLIGAGNESSNNKLIDKLRSLNILDHVNLLGEVSDPFSLCTGSEIFVLHSISEGFPNALGEAMARGLVSISTDAGDATHLLGSDEYVVPTKDSDAMAELMMRVMKMNHNDRVLIGIKNRQRIQNQFQMKSKFDEIREIYKAVV